VIRDCEEVVEQVKTLHGDLFEYEIAKSGEKFDSCDAHFWGNNLKGKTE
jgi:hypothetical protein